MSALLKRFLIVITTLSLLLFAAAPAFAQQTVPTAIINTGNLNLRAGPGLEFGSISVLPEGFGVYLLGRNAASSWVFISTATNVQGWVNVNYIKTNTRISSLPINDTQPATPVTPSASLTGIFSLPVHVNPDGGSAVLTSVSLNQWFDLLGRNYNSNWAQIRLADGTTGWVEAKYLSGTVPIRSLAMTDGSVFVPLTPDNTTSSSGGQTRGNTRYHTIKYGETLAGIAKIYNVDIYSLAAANSIYNINLIYAGQTLVIPSR
ncbi:MAG TPA: SH3 domain-containing protein [Phototrophicaceae bacterium]|jgi:uncharacterized protein YraI|nr:SH3 domain-containing protein [Phototrophicaceae bacterium]